jgi:hypothetical protein
MVRQGTQGFATNEFLFKFGWLLGPAYLLPWLFLYCAFIFARWLLTSRNG